MNPWTVAHQAPLCVGFSHWSGMPFPSFPGRLSHFSIAVCYLSYPCQMTTGTKLMACWKWGMGKEKNMWTNQLRLQNIIMYTCSGEAHVNCPRLNQLNIWKQCHLLLSCAYSQAGSEHHLMCVQITQVSCSVGWWDLRFYIFHEICWWLKDPTLSGKGPLQTCEATLRLLLQFLVIVVCWCWNWTLLYPHRGFPGGASGKEPACQCRRQKRW